MQGTPLAFAWEAHAAPTGVAGATGRTANPAPPPDPAAVAPVLPGATDKGPAPAAEPRRMQRDALLWRKVEALEFQNEALRSWTRCTVICAAILAAFCVYLSAVVEETRYELRWRSVRGKYRR